MPAVQSPTSQPGIPARQRSTASPFSGSRWDCGPLVPTVLGFGVLAGRGSPASLLASQCRSVPGEGASSSSPAWGERAGVTHNHKKCHARRHHQQPWAGSHPYRVRESLRRSQPPVAASQWDGDPAQEHPSIPAWTWVLSPGHPAHCRIFWGSRKGRGGLFGEEQRL